MSGNNSLNGSWWNECWNWVWVQSFLYLRTRAEFESIQLVIEVVQLHWIRRTIAWEERQERAYFEIKSSCVWAYCHSRYPFSRYNSYSITLPLVHEQYSRIIKRLIPGASGKEGQGGLVEHPGVGLLMASDCKSPRKKEGKRVKRKRNGMTRRAVRQVERQKDRQEYQQTDRQK